MIQWCPTDIGWISWMDHVTWAEEEIRYWEQETLSRTLLLPWLRAAPEHVGPVGILEHVRDDPGEESGAVDDWVLVWWTPAAALHCLTQLVNQLKSVFGRASLNCPLYLDTELWEVLWRLLLDPPDLLNWEETEHLLHWGHLLLQHLIPVSCHSLLTVSWCQLLHTQLEPLLDIWTGHDWETRNSWRPWSGKLSLVCNVKLW